MPPPLPPAGFVRPTRAATAPPPGFQRKPWIQVEQDPPIEVGLGDSLAQTAGEWGDVISGLPRKVYASAASTVSGMQAAELAKLQQAYLGGAPRIGPEVAGKTPEEAAAIAEGHLLDELAIGREAAADLQPTEGATFAQHGLEVAAQSLIPSASAAAVGLLTRNPAAAAATMYPSTSGPAFAGFANQMLGAEQQRQAETNTPAQPIDYERALRGGEREGILEVATEALPFSAILKAGTPAVKRLAEVLLAELPGETLATLTQAINAQLVMQPNGEAPLDAVFGGLEEGGRQIPETLVAAILGSAAQTAPFAALEAVQGQPQPQPAPAPAPPIEQMMGSVQGAPALPAPVLEVTPGGVAARPGEMEQAGRAAADMAAQMGMTPDVVANLQRIDAEKAAQPAPEIPALPPPDTTLYVDEAGNAQTIGGVEEFLRAIGDAIAAQQGERADLGLTPDVQANIDRLEARKTAPEAPTALPAPDSTIYVDEAGRAGTAAQRTDYTIQGNQALKDAATEAEAMGFTADVADAGLTRAGGQAATVPTPPAGFVRKGKGQIPLRNWNESTQSIDETPYKPTTPVATDADLAGTRAELDQYMGVGDQAANAAIPPSGIAGTSQSQNVTPARGTLADPETRRNLEAMKGMTGQAAKGGVQIREGAQDPTGLKGEGQGDVKGRTKWAPRASWWTDRPYGMTEKQVHSVIDKALAGEKLGTRQQAMLDYLLKNANEPADPNDRRSTDEQRAGGERRAPPPRETPDRRVEDRRKRMADMTKEELERELGVSQVSGLASKRAFEERERLPAIASIDIDGLGWINDNMGHDAGNRLLKAVGDTIADLTPHGYHFHGDEFVIEGATPEELKSVMETLDYRLALATIEGKDENGAPVVVEGIGMSYGTGTNYAEADANLARHKDTRTAQGARAPKGQAPPGAYKGERDEDDHGGEDSQAPAELTDDELDAAGAEPDPDVQLNEAPARQPQTETAAFQKWFGDSKVVDENGDPLRVYHGTTKDFTKFAVGDIGYHFGDQAAAGWRMADSRGDEGADGNRVIPAYLRIEKPLRLPDLGTWSPGDIKANLKAAGVITEEQADDVEIVDMEQVRDWLAAKGYDGIVYLNRGESAIQDGDVQFTAETPDDYLRKQGATDSWIAFRPGQIKSAVGNRGTFDRNEEDIALEEQKDLFGKNETAQQIADRKLELEKKRSGTRDVSADTGAPGDLFTTRKQADIEDVTGKNKPKAQESPRGWAQAEGRPGGESREKLRAAVRKAFKGWKNAPEARFVESSEWLPEHILKRAKVSRGREIVGVYDPSDNSVYLNLYMLDTAEDAVWTAAHEINGHLGLRGLIGKMMPDARARLDKALQIAGQNMHIDELAIALREQRDALSEIQSYEEALAELQGAHATGRYDRIFEKYGVEVPAGIRGEKQTPAKSKLGRAIDNFLRRLREIMHRILGYNVTDEQIAQLLEGARRYVREGVESDTGLSKTPKTKKAAAPEKPAKRIREPQLEEEGPKLSAVHNLSAENLEFADKMGGLAMPSIAVVPKGQTMRNYGEISLIGGRELADPKEGVPVFDADAYTQTFPQPDYATVPRKKAQAVVDEYRPFAEKFEGVFGLHELWDNAVNKAKPDSTISQLTREPAAIAWFLDSKGETLEPVMQTYEPQRYPWVDTPTFRAFLKGRKDAGLVTYDSEGHKAMTVAVKAAIDEYVATKHPNLGDARLGDLDLADLMKGGVIGKDSGHVAFGSVDTILRDAEKLGREVQNRGATRDAANAAIAGREAEYQQWLSDRITGMYKPPRVKVGKRLMPYTLPNIVEAMRGQKISGAQDTMTFGEGQARAHASTRFTELQWMRNASYQIRPEEEINAAREKAKEELAAYRETALDHYSGRDWRGNVDTWHALDASMRALAQWAKRGRSESALRAALRKEGFERIDDELLELGQQAGRSMMDAPVPYFEAKPQRIVMLNEFSGAVVPDKVSPKTISLLEKHGIPYRTYPTGKDNEDARAAVVEEFRNELAAAGEDVLFQDEKKQGELDVDRRRGPRFPQTESPGFQRWFKDSKVVDDEGKPLRVYHATHAGDFKGFVPRSYDIGMHFGTKGQAADRFYQVRSRKNAPDARPRTIPVYLSIQKPLEIDRDVGDWGDVENVISGVLESDGVPLKLRTELENTRDQDFPGIHALRAWFMARGYDGISYVNTFEVAGAVPIRERMTELQKQISKFMDAKTPSDAEIAIAPLQEEISELHDQLEDVESNNAETSWIAFDSTQIKSAIGNKGSFDPSTPDIALLEEIPKTDLPKDDRNEDVWAIEFNAIRSDGKGVRNVKRLIDEGPFATRADAERFLKQEVGLKSAAVKQMTHGEWTRRIEEQDIQLHEKDLGTTNDEIALAEGTKERRVGQRRSGARSPATGRRAGDRKAPSVKGDRGYKKAAQRVIDVWNRKIGYAYGALGKLPATKTYLKERYQALGRIGKAEDVARQVFDAFKNATPAEAKQIYAFLITKGADARYIDNQKLRVAAKHVKSTIDNVGQRLVEEGLLSQEAYEAHAGEYLPRVYLKHLLGERAVKAIGAGKSTSDMGYLKKRLSEEALPKEVREVLLGEITDPAFLASFSLGRSLRDLALLDFFKTIAGKKQWVPENATVDWNGRAVSPLWLHAEAQRLRKRARQYEPDVAVKARDMATKMEELADTAKEKLEASDLSDYRQMPDSPRYGMLRGLWIRKEIYNDLVGQRAAPAGDGLAEKVLGDGGVLSGLTRAFKISKVVLNPPSQVRNFVSNLMLLQLSGVPAHLVPKRIYQALRSITAKDKYWQIYEKYGGTAATWQASEVKEITREWLRLKELEPNPLSRMLALGGTIVNKASNAYGVMEGIGKIAKLIDEMERNGASESDAMLAAHEALFDYSLVNPNVRYLRNNPLGAPFITFQYKVLPQLAKTAIKSPLRFAPYALIPALLAQMFMADYDVDDDDVEKLKAAFPAWMRERGQMLLLPIKDELNRWQVVDFGYLVPWGLPADLWATAQENPGKATKNLAQQAVLGGPLTDVAAAIETNIDPFTGREIVNPSDPPRAKAMAMLLYAWNLAAPGFLTERGAIPQAVRAAEGNVNYRGERGQTFGQALLRMFGINVYPVDAEKTRAANIRAMEYDLTEMEARAAELIRDRNLSSSERDEIRATWRAMMKQQAERIEQYSKDSQIPPNLRNE